jgi:hypothetical protein
MVPLPTTTSDGRACVADVLASPQWLEQHLDDAAVRVVEVVSAGFFDGAPGRIRTCATASGAQRVGAVGWTCIFRRALPHKGFVPFWDGECREMMACLRVVCG